MCFLIWNPIFHELNGVETRKQDEEMIHRSLKYGSRSKTNVDQRLMLQGAIVDQKKLSEGAIRNQQLSIKQNCRNHQYGSSRLDLV